MPHRLILKVTKFQLPPSTRLNTVVKNILGGHHVQPMSNRVKVTPATFWLKCKNLPKCTKFCSTHKLEVPAKNFGLLTKNRVMHWQMQGLERQHVRQFLCCMLESLNSNFACGNMCTHVILLPIGPQQSLLMIIK